MKIISVFVLKLEELCYNDIHWSKSPFKIDFLYFRKKIKNIRIKNRNGLEQY